MTKAVKQNVNDSQFAVPEEVKQRAIALWKEDQQALGTSESSAKALGAVLNKIKAVCPHAQFNPWLKRHGIDRNRATYCMRVSNGKQAKSQVKKTAAVPEGFKRVSVLLKDAMYTLLGVIVKPEGGDLSKYLSNVVMEHAKAQEKAATKIEEAIAAADREREQAIEQAKVDKAKAEAKKKAEALVAKAQQLAAVLVAAAQEKAAAATA